MFSVPAAIQRGGGAPPGYTTEFVTVWKTTTPNETVAIPTFSVGTYNAPVVWGDGEPDGLITGHNAGNSHVYAVAGEYEVVITGTFSQFYAPAQTVSRLLLLKVLNLGDTSWASFSRAFDTCSNMEEFIAGSTFSSVSISAPANATFQNCSGVTNYDLSGWSNAGITSLDSFGRSSVSMGVGHFDMALVTTCANMLTWNYMSVADYDALLIGWANQAPAIQSNVTLGANKSKYTGGGAAEAARNLLTGTYSWTIADGGIA